MNKPTLPYYYASGQEVALEIDRAHQALDLTATPGAHRAAVVRVGRELSPHVVLLDAALGLGAAAATAAAHGALQLPVFKSGAMLLVALPEVRIEDEDSQALARVQGWLAAQPGHGRVLESRSGRLTLQAGPAVAHDSVTLAREVVEHCGVASASPRLLRVTPAPKR